MTSITYGAGIDNKSIIMMPVLLLQCTENILDTKWLSFVNIFVTNFDGHYENHWQSQNFGNVYVEYVV